MLEVPASASGWRRDHAGAFAAIQSQAELGIAGDEFTLGQVLNQQATQFGRAQRLQAGRE
jgi:hypothetical protein